MADLRIAALTKTVGGTTILRGVDLFVPALFPKDLRRVACPVASDSRRRTRRIN